MTMLKPIRLLVLFGTLVVFLYLVNSNIIRAEQRLASGTPVYLELAPVDPRSLIQGDYMTLDYQVERVANRAEIGDTRRGQLVVAIDDNNVAQFDRVYTEGETLAEGELLLQYLTVDGDVRVGVDSFFFQEGLADEYDAAEYAEVRVTEGGGVMLVDLVGEAFEALVEQ